MREAREFQKSDERVLGDGDFVEEVLRACDEAMERRYSLRAKGYDLEKAVMRVSDLMKLKPSQIVGAGKEREEFKRGAYCVIGQSGSLAFPCPS